MSSVSISKCTEVIVDGVISIASISIVPTVAVVPGVCVANAGRSCLKNLALSLPFPISLYFANCVTGTKLAPP